MDAIMHAGRIQNEPAGVERSRRSARLTGFEGGDNMKYGGFFVLTWLAAAAVGRAQGLPRASDAKSGIPFEVNRVFGAILIRAQVNKQPATLIVDTGSSHTILSSELLRVCPRALEHADLPAKGSGFVGSAGWAKATVEVGTVAWLDRRVLVMNDFRDMSNSMKQRVDGILGEDVLKEFSLVVIDFKHHRLLLLR
jgi:hypothetical protein